MNGELSIEKSIARIEEIVGLLSDSSVTLDASLKLYSEGMELSQRCMEDIKTAEQVVEQHTVHNYSAGEAQP